MIVDCLILIVEILIIALQLVVVPIQTTPIKIIKTSHVVDHHQSGSSTYGGLQMNLISDQFLPYKHYFL